LTDKTLSPLSESKRRVVASLMEGPITSLELAERLGINESAARAHLEGLETAGLARSYFKQVGLGRPKKFFELTDRGRELLPRDYELLLNLLLSKLPEAGGEAVVAQVLEAMAKELASRIRTGKESADGEARARSLVRGLNNLGFKAHLERDGNELILVRDNCIFYKAALEHQDLICHKFDTEFLKAVMRNQNVELRDCMARGGHACRNVVLGTVSEA